MCRTRFIYALSGCFAIYDGDKTTYIETDSSFLNVSVCKYRADTDDADWEDEVYVLPDKQRYEIVGGKSIFDFTLFYRYFLDKNNIFL